MTCLGETKVPPHQGFTILISVIPTCQGIEKGDASVPPITLLETGLPHSNTSENRSFIGYYYIIAELGRYLFKPELINSPQLKVEAPTTNL